MQGAQQQVASEITLQGTCLKAISLCIKLDFLVLIFFSLVVLVSLPEVPLPIVPPWGLPIFQKYLKIPTCLATYMINHAMLLQQYLKHLATSMHL